MKEMMERAGNSHLLTILSYPNAGHLIEPPYTPHFRFTIFKTVMAQQKSELRGWLVVGFLRRVLAVLFLPAALALWGGTMPAHAQAQEDSWRKTLCFLRHNLYGTLLANL